MAGDDSNVLVANSLDSAATPARRKIKSSFNYFEEKKVNIRRFGECSFFYIKRPINIESHMYEVSKMERTLYILPIFLLTNNNNTS